METVIKKRKRTFTLNFKLFAVKYAEANSGEAAARRFNVHPKCIREWRKLKDRMRQTKQSKKKRKKRLDGAGRKSVSEELEDCLAQWIISQREKNLPVSRLVIRSKALELFQTVQNKNQENFTASIGWLRGFLRRKKLTLRNSSSMEGKNDKEKGEKQEFLRNTTAITRSNVVTQTEQPLSVTHLITYQSLLKNSVLTVYNPSNSLNTDISSGHLLSESVMNGRFNSSEKNKLHEENDSSKENNRSNHSFESNIVDQRKNSSEKTVLESISALKEEYK